MTVERMNPLDVWFLHVEDECDQMHIGSVGIFEGPPPEFSAIRRIVAAKLPMVPQYRQRVRSLPLGLARPVWVDDPHFDLGYHLRHTALPAPGTERQLKRLVGRLMTHRLDRDRPLWEMWVIEGVEDDRWAVVSKVHHAMVDGIAGTDLLALILDHRREQPVPMLEPWHPAPEPSSLRLLWDAASGAATRPADWVRSVRAATRPVRDSLRTTAETVRGAAALAGLLRLTPPSSLNGKTGPHRRWDVARASLAEVKAVKEDLGGTVNDVVLAAITHGFRELLIARDELGDHPVVRSMVPVSIRGGDDRSAAHNHVAALFAELAVNVEDPVGRYQAVREEMNRLKASGEDTATSVLVGASGIVPSLGTGTVLRLGTVFAQKVGQRAVNTVTTNVPGPQFPLYLAGRRMLEAFPYVPIAESVRIGIAIFSYDGNVTFGVTGDRDTTGDLYVLAQGIEDGMRQLTAAVSASTRSTSGAAAAATP